jgi:hypothetical protein
MVNRKKRRGVGLLLLLLLLTTDSREPCMSSRYEAPLKRVSKMEDRG